MKPTQNLPEDYRPLVRLDLLQNPRLLLWLNLAGFGLLVISGGLFIRILFWLRPADAATGLAFSISGLESWPKMSAALVTATAVMIVLHEGIHGFFLWLFTRARPVFAFKGYYASAAVPGWYLPRNQYLVVSLAPLTLITLLGCVLLAAAPPAWLLPLLLVLTFNASGAVGDLLVAAWLLRTPGDALAFDTGEAVTLYVRRPPAG